MTRKKIYPTTPDGRYFVAKDRLWRCTNPALAESDRRAYIKQLMQSRLAVKHATSEAEMADARARVNTAKILLGERGPVWWNDGAPDVTRHHPKNTVYAEWWRDLQKD